MWGFPAGLIGGRIYFLITSWDQVPDALVGSVRDLGGRTRDLGRDPGRHARRSVGAPPPAARTSRAFMDCGRAGAARGAGDRPDRQLLQPGAVRRSRRRCRGVWRSLPRTVPTRYLQSATFQPTFLYEIIWNLVARRVPGLARQPPQDPRRRGCSRSTSRATRRSASSRSCCGSIPRTTSSGCG